MGVCVCVCDCTALEVSTLIHVELLINFQQIDSLVFRTYMYMYVCVHVNRDI